MWIQIIWINFISGLLKPSEPDQTIFVETAEMEQFAIGIIHVVHMQNFPKK